MTASDLARLKPHLEDTTLAQNDVLFQADEPIEQVYFPLSGVVALHVSSSDGSVVEAATIGNEGVVGLGGLLSGDVSYTRQIVPLPGRAMRIARDPFLSIVGDSHSLRPLLASHADAFMAHVLQSAACNALHSTEERLARWLLSSLDRCPTTRVGVTHEYLAMALGVRRPTVTLILRSLQAAKIVDSSRGVIAVLDRDGLEQISCECYDAIKRNYQRARAHFKRAAGGGS